MPILPWIGILACYANSGMKMTKEEHDMNKVYGLFSIGGFMATMLCYVIAGIEVTKLELTITFLTWLGMEVLIWGIQKVLRLFLQHKKRAGVSAPAHFHN